MQIICNKHLTIVNIWLTIQSDEFLAALYNNYDALKDLRFMSKHNTGGWTVEDATKRRAFMEQVHERGEGLNAVVEMKEGGYAGVAGFRDLNWWNRSAEMGIILHPDYWSRGLATEIHLLFLTWAFEEMHLNRVEFKTSVNNAGMNYLCKEVMHATLEGTIRECFPSVDCSPYRNDSINPTNIDINTVTFEAVNLYSILRSEWPHTKELLLARMSKRKA